MAKEKVYSILILDDEAFILRPLERALRAKGYIVWGTMDPNEAMRLVEGHRPSVACIDLQMTKVNGVQVIKKMREIIPDIRIVIVTGHLGEFQKEVNELKLRVLEKSTRTARELEAVLAEELELSAQDLDALEKRKKPRSRLRILFVDDDKEQADFSCEIVMAEGIEAESAHSPEEALEKALSFKPNVLCTDLEMLNIPGDKLIRRMKDSSEYSFVKVYVGITGFPHKKDRFFEAGASEVLDKPVNLGEFLAALKRWEGLLAGKTLKTGADLK